VEALAAAQAVDIRACYKDLSQAGKTTFEAVREKVPMLDADRYMGDDLEAIAQSLRAGQLDRCLRDAGVDLI
jgi:histidine ammonia-lyase